jgi:hypothetical protein
MDLKAGLAGQSVQFAAWTTATGAPVTVTAATAGLSLWYRRGVVGAKVPISVADLATLETAWASGKILVIEGAEHRLDLPDAAIAAGVLTVSWGGTATGITIDGSTANLIGQANSASDQTHVAGTAQTGTELLLMQIAMGFVYPLYCYGDGDLDPTGSHAYVAGRYRVNSVTNGYLSFSNINNMLLTLHYHSETGRWSISHNSIGSSLTGTTRDLFSSALSTADGATGNCMFLQVPATSPLGETLALDATVSKPATPQTITPPANMALNSTVAKEATLAAAAAALALLDTAGVTFSSPVAENGEVTIYQGDDYLAADGRQLAWSSDDWPVLTGAAIVLTLKHTHAQTVSIAGVASSATSCYVELTAAQTVALTPVRPSYTFGVVATLSDGSVVTLVTGTAIVKPKTTA